jgi:hypothetical protein
MGKRMKPKQRRAAVEAAERRLESAGAAVDAACNAGRELSEAELEEISLATVGYFSATKPGSKLAEPGIVRLSVRGQVKGYFCRACERKVKAAHECVCPARRGA